MTNYEIAKHIYWQLRVGDSYECTVDNVHEVRQYLYALKYRYGHNAVYFSKGLVIYKLVNVNAKE